jgi:tetratricopeptide (TPR) repeat protein
MDRLSAHLDRGWDLAQRGDAQGAIACGRRALELDPKSPEVHNLLGYAAALAGETDEAIEHYRQAIALDEGYFEAMLNAVEVLMSPLADWDEAARMCDEARALAETSEEVADCVLLKVDALIGKGDFENAANAMKQLPDDVTNPAYLFLMGRAFYELGDMEKAAPLIEEAARRDPAHPDAHYYLGLLRDENGDARGATEAFLRARAIDVDRAGPQWSPSPETFGKLVEHSIGKLDAVLARYVREVEVFVIDVPGAEIVVDGVDPRALMLLDPATPEGRPTRLYVYQRNVERSTGGLETLESELVGALEREITAVFLDDPDKQPPRDQLN